MLLAKHETSVNSSDYSLCDEHTYQPHVINLEAFHFNLQYSLVNTTIVLF